MGSFNLLNETLFVAILRFSCKKCSFCLFVRLHIYIFYHNLSSCILPCRRFIIFSQYLEWCFLTVSLIRQMLGPIKHGKTVLFYCGNKYICYIAGFPKSAHPHWLLRGHMTSNIETASRENLWAGNIAKSMTSQGNSALLPANVDLWRDLFS